MLPLKTKKARLHLLNIFKEGSGAAELIVEKIIASFANTYDAEVRLRFENKR